VARIAGVNIPTNKRVTIALRYIQRYVKRLVLRLSAVWLI